MKKVFLIAVLAFVAVASVFCCFLFRGNSEYKSVEVNGKTMKATVSGSGNKTIVMLSRWNADSPIDDFFPLYDKLSKDYKVVVLEYFGYSGSDITTDERTNQKIVQEIREALHKLNVTPPYILMPHSMSGLYSLYYAHNYPAEVSGIIGLDMSLPQNQLEQWDEDTFEKAKLNQESSHLNISVINQWNKFYDNSKELKDLKYPSELPVISFISAGQIKTVDDMIKDGALKTSLLQINNNMITNPKIQTVKILESESELSYSQTDEIVKISKEFIDNL